MTVTFELINLVTVIIHVVTLQWMEYRVGREGAAKLGSTGRYSVDLSIEQLPIEFLFCHKLNLPLYYLIIGRFLSAPCPTTPT